MRTTSALLVASALLCAPVMSPAIARADDGMPVPAKARELAQRGRAYHDAGDYGSAIAAFTQAYVIAPSPALLFNLAQAYRLQGNCDDAALMYQRYLATNPSPEGRALAEGHLATVERCMHKIALHIPVEKASATSSVVATHAPAASLSVDAAQSSHKAEIEKDVGLGLGLAGTGALAAALFFAVRANNASNDVSNAEAPPPAGGKGGGGKTGGTNVGAIDDRGESAASTARVLAIGGGLGLAAGVVMYVIGRRDEQAPVVVAPTTRGAAVSMRWSF
ncbi:MAG TPA: tetratricopeptide repeat protein [Kofleriaceae bacterium]|nr:tetratricopeptide repeat protein [Kofleriaceae bacterium]